MGLSGSTGSPSIADSVARVRDRIAGAARDAGRDPASITLVAVTKTVEIARIGQAIRAGITDLGENYIQEARDKLSALGPEVRWHFIGHLQSNKVRYAVGNFALIQSVDTERLGVEIGRRSAALGTLQHILVEVKLDPFGAKFGVEPDMALDLVGALAGVPGLAVDGLMGMPPLGGDPEAARPYFARLRRLYDELPVQHRVVLSMGMSGDFEQAICEGATMVRVGTAIFGHRPSSL